MQGFVCAFQGWSLFAPILWKSYSQILLSFKAKFPGDSQSLCWIRSLGSLTWGSEPSQQWENFFGVIVLLSSLWVTHLAGVGSDFIVIVLSLLSRGGCFFVFGRGVSVFLVFSSVLLSMVVQQLVVILVLLQKGMSACPSPLLLHHLEMEPLFVVFM